MDGSYYRNAANLTGTLFIEITGTVPDSEKLNGQSGSYYRDITNITGALTTGSSLLYGDGSGRFANATIGSGLLFSGGVLHATGVAAAVLAEAFTPTLSSSTLVQLAQEQLLKESLNGPTILVR